DVANPHRKLAAVNPKTAASSVRFRPKKLAIQPVIGRMIALATRYDVSAHAASSVLTERLPAICGSDTFTTVVSSTSMKVAHITATATIHGFTWGVASDGIPVPCFHDAANRREAAVCALALKCPLCSIRVLQRNIDRRFGVGSLAAAGVCAICLVIAFWKITL